MPGLPMLRAPLAANAPAHPLDVVWLKSALQALGHYQAPDWGISPYPDRALFDAVRAFQDDRGLAADGSLKPGGATWSALTDRLDGEAGPQTLRAAARALQSLGRGGDTILAHITVEEARLLKTLGGSGTVNPATGLMEFWGRLGGSTFERERAAKAALREASTTRALEKRQRSGDWDATRGRTLGYNDFNPGGLHGDKNRDGSPKDAEGLDRHKRAVEQNEAKALAKAGVHALPERLYAHATITPTDPRRRRGKGLNADATMAMHFGLGGDGELFTQVSEERPQDLDTFGIETLGEAAFTKTPDKAEQARIAGRILGLADEPGQRALKSHATLSGPSLSSMTAATGPEAQPKPSSKPKPKTTRTVSPAHQALMDRVNAKIAANRARVKNYLDEADAMKAEGLKMTADNRKVAWARADGQASSAPDAKKYEEPPIAPNKLNWYAAHPGLDKTRTQFFQALVKAGLPQTTINSLMAVLDQEGGLTKHGTGSAYGGITQETLTELVNDGRVPGVEPGTSPQNLTPQQAAEAYKGFFNDAFKAKNGVNALNLISDSDAQTVLVDSLFSHGLDAGTRVIQQGINVVTGGSLGEPDGIPGSKTLDALEALTNNPQTKDETLNAIADARLGYVKQIIPANELAGWQNRIDVLRPLSNSP